MWIHSVIVLGVVYLYLISHIILCLIAWIGPFILPSMCCGSIPAMFDVFAHLPMYQIVAVTYAVFDLGQLPTADWFRYWSGWEWVRHRWLRVNNVNYQPPFLGQNGDIDVYLSVPHGLYPWGFTMGIMLNSQFRHVTSCIAKQLFWIPIVCEFVSLWGGISATRENIVTELDNGRSISIAPEGVRSQLLLNERPRTESMMRVMEKRKGLFKLLVAHKYAHRIRIVPMYIPAQWSMYRVWVPWPSLQNWLLTKISYTGPIFAAGWYGTFIPRPDTPPCNIFFGDPLCIRDLPLSTANNNDDDDDDADTATQLHRITCDSIVSLMEKYGSDVY